MTSAEINTIIKRMCLDQNIPAAALTQAQTDAIIMIGNALVSAVPEYFSKKKALINDGTSVFDLPSDNRNVQGVWDYNDTAAEISGAADNGSGLIRITATAHGFSDADRVTIHDIVGTTEANDTWIISYVSANAFDLVGSTFASAYTSGGYAFKDDADTYAYPLSRLPAPFKTLADANSYYMIGSTIVVDYSEFENDLIVEYRYGPSSLSDIPARFHNGIYAFGVINLIDLRQTVKLPGGKAVQSDEYATRRKNHDFCKGIWDSTIQSAMAFNPYTANKNLSNVKKVKHWI